MLLHPTTTTYGRQAMSASWLRREITRLCQRQHILTGYQHLGDDVLCLASVYFVHRAIQVDDYDDDDKGGTASMMIMVYNVKSSTHQTNIWCPYQYV